MRVKRGTVARQRRKKRLKRAAGFRGALSRCVKVSFEKSDRALAYAYRDRRVRKRDFRALWIQRINAAARLNGWSYSRLMHALQVAGIELNRKILSEIALHDPTGFQAMVKGLPTD